MEAKSILYRLILNDLCKYENIQTNQITPNIINIKDLPSAKLA